MHQHNSLGTVPLPVPSVPGGPGPHKVFGKDTIMSTLATSSKLTSGACREPLATVPSAAVLSTAAPMVSLFENLQLPLCWEAAGKSEAVSLPLLHCSGCNQELQQECFTSKQRWAPAHSRRCESCAGDAVEDKVLPLSGPPWHLLQASVDAARLGADVQSSLGAVALRQKECELAQGCLKELREIVVRALGSRWCVQPFGSFANGFATRRSDLDAVCFEEGATADQAQNSQRRALQCLEGHLSTSRFQIIEKVWSAKVPILKLRFARQLDVDLSSQNTEPLPNTRLLAHYAGLHPAVHDLGVAVKLWAKEEGVCGAPNGHLSSYTLTLMVIYFLQVDRTLGMPCLPPQACGSRDKPPDKMPCGSWNCPEPLAWLICRFFHFYVVEFQWGTEVVSVRLGRRAHRTEREFVQLPGRWASRVHIEDPFFLNRNLNRVLGFDQERQLQVKLIAALESLQAGATPKGLAGSHRVHRAVPAEGQGDDADDGSTRSGSRGSHASEGGNSSGSDSEGARCSGLGAPPPLQGPEGAGEVQTAGPLECASAKWLGPERRPVCTAHPSELSELQ